MFGKKCRFTSAGRGIRNKRGEGGEQELNVSKSYAYKVVREQNTEMRGLGYLTVSGRANTNFFRKKLCYSE